MAKMPATPTWEEVSEAAHRVQAICSTKEALLQQQQIHQVREAEVELAEARAAWLIPILTQLQQEEEVDRDT